MRFAFIALLCLGIAGCVTKKLVVFDVLSDRQMAKFMGDYKVAGDVIKTGTLRFQKKDTRYRFEIDWEAANKKKYSAKGHFLLSRIPISKSRPSLVEDIRTTFGTDGIFVISSPDLKDSEGADFSKNSDDNFWGVLKRDGSKLYFWIVSDPKNMPVAKGNLKDQTNVESVKDFLKKHALAFTQANKPMMTFSRIKK